MKKSTIINNFELFSLQDGRSALHYAAAFARDDIVKLLINKKADATLLGGVSEYTVDPIIHVMLHPVAFVRILIKLLSKVNCMSLFRAERHKNEGKWVSIVGK